MTPLPGLSEEEFAELARRFPTPPPQSLRMSRGIELKKGQIIDLAGFEGGDGGQSLDELFPHALQIAVDGCGNSWCLELGGPEWGPVFFCGHDPPIVVFQAATGEEFVRQMSRRKGLPDVHECREHLLPEEDGWEWIDLRTPELGDGFCWGQFGPYTELRRFPTERIFGRRRPAPREPSASRPWWKKLFGLLIPALLQAGLGPGGLVDP